LSFYNKPILWSQQQQLSGDFMQLFTKNKAADYLHIQKAAMAISKEADSLYNQLSGKDLIAYFDSGKVVRVEIKGNAETVYLPRDTKSKELTGLNSLEGSSLTLFLENEKMKKIIVWPKPKGTYYPLNLLPPDVRYLKNFAWYNELRPISPGDVLREVKVPVKTNVGSITGRQTEKASDKPLNFNKSKKNTNKTQSINSHGRKNKSK
jgi:hypothetical protein